mgnify:CR=1 FL=1|tara:strand:- start:5389 stop:6192 length:804 start_codon:yes stop_codon:yes gene_type:complete
MKSLEYDNKKEYLPDDCELNISPSGFANFVQRKHQWYRENVLKEEGFTGSTSSVLGTIVHAIAECVATDVPVDIEAIEKYVYANAERDPEICADTVLDNYEQMATELVNSYVIPNMENYLEVESVHMAGLGDGIYVSGSLDVLEGTKEDACVVDYKTYNSKSTPKSIPQNYKYQLLVYAFLLKYNGYNPTRIKLVYVSRNIDGGLSEKTGNPLKSYPPTVTVLVEAIDEEGMEFIEGLLNLCKDTVKAGEKYPELLHVIWQDPRLKS